LGKLDAQARRFSADVGHFEGRVVEFHPDNQRQGGTRIRLKGTTNDQEGEREDERDQAREASTYFLFISRKRRLRIVARPMRSIPPS
jgi:hypothetical protein